MFWGWMLTALAFGGLTASLVLQVLPCLKRIRRLADSGSASARWPRAQVILSLKGTDPFLERCLARLAAQDYPDYRVTVVVDSTGDPAWEQASAAQMLYGRDVIDVRVRSHTSSTCTRKLSNLLTAFDCLPAEVEVVALCDGDAVVHPTWLRELAGGLRDPSISAVAGNRWYSPTTCGLASLSRYYWNVVAIPTTQQHRILWGGSLAVRRDVVDESGFRAAFAEGFADDTLIASYLHGTGRKYEVLGATYVINSETTSLRSYWNFLVRQMLCVRLHHPRWRPICLHAVVLALAMMGLLPALLASGREGAAAALSGLALYGLTLLALSVVYERRLRAVFPDLEALHVPVTGPRIAMALPALLFTAVFYPAATIRAAWTRCHRWRGVEYRLTKGKITSTLDHSETLERLRPSSDAVPRPRFLRRRRRKEQMVREPA